MPTPRTRLFGGTALLLVAAALTACSEGNPGPTSPLAPSFDAQLDVTPVPFASTSVLWDFAAIIPGTDDPEDLGTSETISLAGNGSIVATSGGDNEHVTVKGRSLPVGATERGLGLCLLDQSRRRVQRG